MKYHVRVNGREHEVVLDERAGAFALTVDGEPLALEYHPVDGFGQALALAGDRSHAVSIEGDESRMGITIGGHFHAVELEDERERAARAAMRQRGPAGGVVKSVMPGIVVQVLVEAGSTVERGAPLLILEAMKMQNEIDAPVAGEVVRVHVEPGRTVSGGDTLVTIRPSTS